MFYKKDMHSGNLSQYILYRISYPLLAMKPNEITEFFQEIIYFSQLLLEQYKKRAKRSESFCQKPIVTVNLLVYYVNTIKYFQVFLDEINTVSCPGYLKEIIVDRTVNGQVR